VSVEINEGSMTMKVLAVGDLHTKTECLYLVDKTIEAEKPDKVVLLGDYLDDWGLIAYENLEAFEAILAWIKARPDVIPLLGNHDIAYIDDRAPRVGHSDGVHEEVKFLFSSNGGLFHVAWGVDNWLFSHAGIHRLWLKAIETYGIMSDEADSPAALAKLLDRLFHTSAGLRALSEVGRGRGGDSAYPSCLWADMSELLTGALTEPLCPNQCVGHTPQTTINTYRRDGGQLLVFCDTFSTAGGNGMHLGDCSVALIDTKADTVKRVELVPEKQEEWHRFGYNLWWVRKPFYGQTVTCCPICEMTPVYEVNKPDMDEATRFRFGCPACGRWTAPFWNGYYAFDAWNHSLFVEEQK
jgi:hypothetical protein